MKAGIKTRASWGGIGKTLIFILIFSSCRGIHSAIPKSFSNLDGATLTLENDSQFSFSLGGSLTGGYFRKVGNQYYFKDTMFNALSINIEPFRLKDSIIGEDTLKISVSYDSKIRAAYNVICQNGLCDIFSSPTNTTMININYVDSFSIGFVYLNSRSRYYKTTDYNGFNSLRFDIPASVSNGISLANEIGFENKNLRSISLTYYAGGVQKTQRLFKSKKDLIRFYRKNKW